MGVGAPARLASGEAAPAIPCFESFAQPPVHGPPAAPDIEHRAVACPRDGHDLGIAGEPRGRFS